MEALAIVLLVVQLAVFVLARLMDDLSWSKWNIPDE